MKVISVSRYKRAKKLTNAIIVYYSTLDYYRITSIHFYKNGIRHRKDGATPIYLYINEKLWHYKDKCCGENDDFTNKTWNKKVKQLKREEELKIFI